jgi:transcriptional regulator with XRE-family HTH domain
MREVCACVVALVDTLKPEYAEAVRQVELGGASVQAYAAAVGISAGQRRAYACTACVARWTSSCRAARYLRRARLLRLQYKAAGCAPQDGGGRALTSEVIASRQPPTYTRVVTVEPLRALDAYSGFGALLRIWRQARGMSQLTLATQAEISCRHLSFLETGRAQPSRAMVQLLGGVLDLPLSERNALLLAAGYAPAYGQRDLAAVELQPVRHAFEVILTRHEPFPAFVVDGQWNVVITNDASLRVFGAFPGERVLAGNPMRNLFHPAGIRRWVVNWQELAGALIQTLHREAQAGHAAAAQLRDELLEYPDVPTRWKTPDPTAGIPPLLTLRLQNADLSLAFFSTITVLHVPQDVTLQELRIECFHPADARTEELVRKLAPA